MIIAALIFIPLYWRAGVYSIAEYLGLRYNQAVRVVAASIFVVVSVFAMGVAMWALAITLQTFLGWPIWLGILVSGTAVGLYSVAGGLGAVAITDSIQVCIMFVSGLIIVAIGISDAGGAERFISELTAENPTHLSAYLPADHESYPWHGVILGLGFVLSPAYWIGSQAILQRTLGARTQWDAGAGMIFAAFAKTLVPCSLSSVCSRWGRWRKSNTDMALPWVIKNVLPVGVSGLMFVAIIAALQSSSTPLTHRPDDHPRHSPRISRTQSDADPKVSVAQLGLLLSAMSLLLRQSGRYLQLLAVIAIVFQGPMLALLLLGALDEPPARHHHLGSGVVGGHIVLGYRTQHVVCGVLRLLCLPLWIISGFTQPHSAEHLKTLTYSPWGVR